ncbi:MAG: hypothetical protein KBT35_07995 [Firmicutes bacterium]|nr:hypothetical protein [Candidatus Colivicinus equi]
MNNELLKDKAENKSIYKHNLHIPTREEFHRSYSGLITIAEFDTSKPNPYNINKIVSSLNFTKHLEKKKTNQENKK